MTGSTSASSYLWAATDGGGSATPFAQAYLRPKLRLKDLSFPVVGTKGLAAVPTRQMFDNFARPQAYGVSGLANGFSTERDTEVRSMAQIGSRMFVGGNFAQVDNYTKGTHTAQAYLAAFDAATGAWIPTFRPTFNGKVNAVVKLPSGALAVGGEFTKVNGATHMGLVVLDPATGKVARGFGAQLQLRTTHTTKPGTVSALAVSGSYLYLGGSFTHAAGGSPLGAYVYAKRGARLTGSGTPDAKWNPAFNAAPIFVTASAKGNRVYYGGFFTTMRDGAETADHFVALRTTSPASKVPGLKDIVTSTTPKSYQQTAVEGSAGLAGRLGTHVLRLLGRRSVPGAAQRVAQRRRAGRGLPGVGASTTGSPTGAATAACRTSTATRSAGTRRRTTTASTPCATSPRST